MGRGAAAEHGQAIVEFALIAMVFLMFTVGLVDVGRAFFQYNALSGAATFASRWGSVVGGQCNNPALLNGADTNDWCNQFNGSTSDFWAQSGNKPLQPKGTTCPTTFDQSFAYYYTASSYASSQVTTIVGAVAHRLDTNSNGWQSIFSGADTPGINLSQVKVCIQLPSTDYNNSRWFPFPGDNVTVFVYSNFTALNTTVTTVTIPLVASSEYPLEAHG